MNENNNILNSNDTGENKTNDFVQTEKNDGGFDIKSFNSYANDGEKKQTESYMYPSVDNVPIAPAGEGRFYTPEPPAAPEIIDDSQLPPPIPADPALIAREYKKAAKRRYSFVAFMIVAMHFIYTIVGSVAILVYQGIVKESETFTSASMVIGSLVIALVAFPFFALTLSKIKTLKMPKTKISFSKLLSFFSVAITAMYAGAFIGRAFGGILGEIFGNPGDQIVSGSLEGVPIWMIIVFTCIFPGIFEELIFRKLIIDKTKDFGLFTSVLFSGLTFGIFHGNFEQFFYALLVGVFFAYVYAKTGKIIYTIILHTMVNFFGSALTVLVENSEIASFIFVIFIFLMWIAGVISLIWEIVDNYQKLKNDRGIQTVGSGDAVLTALLNPGMIVFLIIFAIEFASMTVTMYGG